MTTNSITSICITITDEVLAQHEYDHREELDMLHYLGQTLAHLGTLLEQRPIVATEACRVTLLYAADMEDTQDNWQLVEGLAVAITAGMEGWRVDTVALFNHDNPLQQLPAISTVETPDRFEPLDQQGLRRLADGWCDRLPGASAT